MEPPQPKQMKIYQFFPQTEFLLWQSGKLDTITNKLTEFNDSLSEADGKLSGAEKANVDEIVKILEQENRYHATTFDKKHFQTLSKLLTWPAAQMLPVLDLIRMSLMHPHAAEYFSTQPAGTPCFPSFSARCLARSLTPLPFCTVIDRIAELLTPPAPSSFAVPIMASRVLCNYFKSLRCRATISPKIAGVLAKSAVIDASSNATLQTCSLFAFVILMNTQMLIFCAPFHMQMVSVSQNDAALFRIIVAVGTLVVSDAALKDTAMKAFDAIKTQQRTSDQSMKAFAELEKLLGLAQ
jgi:hypothetical protein